MGDQKMPEVLNKPNTECLRTQGCAGPTKKSQCPRFGCPSHSQHNIYRTTREKIDSILNTHGKARAIKKYTLQYNISDGRWRFSCPQSDLGLNGEGGSIGLDASGPGTLLNLLEDALHNNIPTQSRVRHPHGQGPTNHYPVTIDERTGRRRRFKIRRITHRHAH